MWSDTGRTIFVVFVVFVVVIVNETKHQHLQQKPNESRTHSRFCVCTRARAEKTKENKQNHTSETHHQWWWCERSAEMKLSNGEVENRTLMYKYKNEKKRQIKNKKNEKKTYFFSLRHRQLLNGLDTQYTNSDIRIVSKNSTGWALRSCVDRRFVTFFFLYILTLKELMTNPSVVIFLNAAMNEANGGHLIARISTFIIVIFFSLPLFYFSLVFCAI